MAISEDQLKTWAKQGPTPQFTATYQTLESCLNDRNSPYYPKDFSIFLQGSYKNDTNVYGDSDVDVVIRLNQIFYSDLSNLPDEDKKLWNAARSDAEYTLEQFKKDVTGWLVKKFGNDVQPGKKAIYIKGTGNRRNADVLVCCKHHRYISFKSWDDQTTMRVFHSLIRAASRLTTFRSSTTTTARKSIRTSKNWFKPTVRIYKNLPEHFDREEDHRGRPRTLLLLGGSVV